MNTQIIFAKIHSFGYFEPVSKSNRKQSERDQKGAEHVHDREEGGRKSSGRPDGPRRREKAAPTGRNGQRIMSLAASLLLLMVEPPKNMGVRALECEQFPVVCTMVSTATTTITKLTYYKDTASAGEHEINLDTQFWEQTGEIYDPDQEIYISNFASDGTNNPNKNEFLCHSNNFYGAVKGCYGGLVSTEDIEDQEVQKCTSSQFTTSLSSVDYCACKSQCNQNLMIKGGSDISGNFLSTTTTDMMNFKLKIKLSTPQTAKTSLARLIYVKQQWHMRNEKENATPGNSDKFGEFLSNIWPKTYLDLEVAICGEEKLKFVQNANFEFHSFDSAGSLHNNLYSTNVEWDFSVLAQAYFAQYCLDNVEMALYQYDDPTIPFTDNRFQFEPGSATLDTRQLKLTGNPTEVMKGYIWLKTRGGNQILKEFKAQSCGTSTLVNTSDAYPDQFTLWLHDGQAGEIISNLASSSYLDYRNYQTGSMLFTLTNPNELLLECEKIQHTVSFWDGSTGVVDSQLSTEFLDSTGQYGYLKIFKQSYGTSFKLKITGTNGNLQSERIIDVKVCETTLTVDRIGHLYLHISPTGISTVRRETILSLFKITPQHQNCAVQEFSLRNLSDALIQVDVGLKLRQNNYVKAISTTPTIIKRKIKVFTGSQKFHSYMELISYGSHDNTCLFLDTSVSQKNFIFDASKQTDYVEYTTFITTSNEYCYVSSMEMTDLSGNAYTGPKVVWEQLHLAFKVDLTSSFKLVLKLKPAFPNAVKGEKEVVFLVCGQEIVQNVAGASTIRVFKLNEEDGEVTVDGQQIFTTSIPDCELVLVTLQKEVSVGEIVDTTFTNLVTSSSDLKVTTASAFTQDFILKGESRGLQSLHQAMSVKVCGLDPVTVSSESEFNLIYAQDPGSQSAIDLTEIVSSVDSECLIFSRQLLMPDGSLYSGSSVIFDNNSVKVMTSQFLSKLEITLKIHLMTDQVVQKKLYVTVCGKDGIQIAGLSKLEYKLVKGEDPKKINVPALFTISQQDCKITKFEIQKKVEAKFEKFSSELLKINENNELVISTMDGLVESDLYIKASSDYQQEAMIQLSVVICGYEKISLAQSSLTYNLTLGTGDTIQTNVSSLFTSSVNQCGISSISLVQSELSTSNYSLSDVTLSSDNNLIISSDKASSKTLFLRAETSGKVREQIAVKIYVKEKESKSQLSFEERLPFLEVVATIGADGALIEAQFFKYKSPVAIDPKGGQVEMSFSEQAFVNLKANADGTFTLKVDRLKINQKNQGLSWIKISLSSKNIPGPKVVILMLKTIFKSEIAENLKETVTSVTNLTEQPTNSSDSDEAELESEPKSPQQKLDKESIEAQEAQTVQTLKEFESQGFQKTNAGYTFPGVDPALIDKAQKTKNKQTIADPSFKVGKISSLGVFDIVFNQDMFAPNTLNHTLYQYAFRISLIIDADGQQLEGTFVEPVRGRSRLLNESKATEGLSLNMTVLDHNSLTIKIKVEFSHPRNISRGYNQDKLVVEILQPYLFKSAQTLKPLSGISSGSMKSIKQVPPLLEKEVMENIQSSIETTQTSINFLSSSNFAVSAILKGSMQSMWSMIRATKMIVFSGLMRVPLPSHTFVFLSGCMLFAQMDLLDGQMVYDQVFEFEPTGPMNEKYAQMDLEDKNFMINSGSYFIMLLLFWGWTLFQYCVNRIAVLLSRSRIWRKIGIWAYNPSFKDTISYGSQKLLMESYLDLAVSAALQAYAFYDREGGSIQLSKFFKGTSNCISSIMALLHLLLLVVFPCYGMFLIRKNLDQLKQGYIPKSMTVFAEGHQNYKCQQAMFSVYFLLRRLFIVVVLVSLDALPYFQCAFFIVTSQINSAYLIASKPMSNMKEQGVELFNELALLCTCYLITTILNIAIPLELSDMLGWIFIGVVTFTVFINIALTAQSSIDQLLRSFTQFRQRRKSYKEVNEFFKDKEEVGKKFPDALAYFENEINIFNALEECKIWRKERKWLVANGVDFKDYPEEKNFQEVVKHLGDITMVKTVMILKDLESVVMKTTQLKIQEIQRQQALDVQKEKCQQIQMSFTRPGENKEEEKEEDEVPELTFSESPIKKQMAKYSFDFKTTRDEKTMTPKSTRYPTKSTNRENYLNIYSGQYGLDEISERSNESEQFVQVAVQDKITSKKMPDKSQIYSNGVSNFQPTNIHQEQNFTDQNLVSMKKELRDKNSLNFLVESSEDEGSDSDSEEFCLQLLSMIQNGPDDPLKSSPVKLMTHNGKNNFMQAVMQVLMECRQLGKFILDRKYVLENNDYEFCDTVATVYRDYYSQVHAQLLDKVSLKELWTVIKRKFHKGKRFNSEKFLWFFIEFLKFETSQISFDKGCKVEVAQEIENFFTIEVEETFKCAFGHEGSFSSEMESIQVDSNLSIEQTLESMSGLQKYGMLKICPQCNLQITHFIRRFKNLPQILIFELKDMCLHEIPSNLSLKQLSFSEQPTLTLKNYEVFGLICESKKKKDEIAMLEALVNRRSQGSQEDNWVKFQKHRKMQTLWSRVKNQYAKMVFYRPILEQ